MATRNFDTAEAEAATAPSNLYSTIPAVDLSERLLEALEELSDEIEVAGSLAAAGRNVTQQDDGWSVAHGVFRALEDRLGDASAYQCVRELAEALRDHLRPTTTPTKE